MYKSVETILVDIPTIRPHKLSVATMQTQTVVLIKVTTEDGIVGWGEATTIGGLSYGEESPESVKTNIDTYFAPLLTSVKNLNVAQTLKLIRKTINGNRFAKCAIQTALLDIQAQRLGLPLSELLGGRLRTGVPVLWVLASGDTEKDIAEAKKMIELKRHNVFKLKIGSNPVEADVEHVLAIKKALGNDISIRVDVNRAWSELEAIRGIQMLQDGGIDLIEQPCALDNIDAMERLTRKFDIAIMADESLSGPQSAYQLAKRSAASVFAIKIAQSAGLHEACEVANIAKLAGIDLYGGTMLEGPVGTIASAHAFSTFENLAYGTELFGPLLLTQDILKTPLRYENFELVLPTGAGLGIELDEDKIDNLRRK
ncbi:muconate/chloromuconate family cycloisomerase [Acinetobacter gerneri]|uniref:Muconate/chloromuconate family cycloisomerase n=1 Tax=Acinetobacter gerneri TaxID=202952 RepID=A0AAW8JE58_9GAMM|nr:muconate/chloromuconate family cycloisomerase [Acinetobacter gerneri]MDQ9008277.1 muconate/chloromuconate family cycloisomerase [Acinetobacter gerneri]MDQ9012309.1 muconate/chloromuconate family cycloisomerase [Acinetobacter gerneri]MDQ9023816.1 muconate/chloromuconate family cycloisomerase [Acinetobacter gerneri]MDQ9051222.1 muconate/chloromuconate family cycloisomerase [Acinetobacter gerneri]MDQ9058919.1 muconate/chloromuconate family cycloisomerase [Acinetobacter gerneri]